MHQEIISGDQSRQKLMAGVDKLANAVKSTLGPRGQNVLIQKEFDGPRVTKDGVTVARSIRLKDPVENMGAQLVVNVAKSTNDKAGDGTTTATVLAQAIYKTSLKMISAGADSNEMRKGMDSATRDIVDYLVSKSVTVSNDLDKIKRVATISANNDQSIGDLIGSAVDVVGNDGIITIDESKTADTFVSTSLGFQFDKGYLSPYFVTNQDTMKVEYQDAFVVVTDKKLSSISGPQDPLVAMLECMANSGRPFIIIAEDIDGTVLPTLVMNKLKAGIKVVCVRAPKLGDMRRQYLEDIALLTGATLISDTTGTDFNVFRNNNTSAAGRVSQLIVTKDSTTLVGGAGDQAKIDEFVASLSNQIELASDREKTALKERKGRISGKVATIYIGADSDLARKELHDLIEDSLNATKAAMEQGIIPGGGSALAHASFNLHIKDEGASEDYNIGRQIIFDAVKAPFLTIMTNAGLKSEVMLNAISELGFEVGINALNGNVENMYEVGIVDPVKVTRMALINAVSIASTLITTSVTIYDAVETKENE